MVVLCSTGVMRLASSWEVDGATFAVFLFRAIADIWVVDFRLVADNIPEGALPEVV